MNCHLTVIDIIPALCPPDDTDHDSIVMNVTAQSLLFPFLCIGITEHVQKMNQRPPPYFGRGDLETLLSSPNAVDWIRISEMLLGPVDDDFSFVPKHKSNSYATPSADGGEGEATSNG